jgi:hypothetical protein
VLLLEIPKIIVRVLWAFAGIVTTGYDYLNISPEFKSSNVGLFLIHFKKEVCPQN